MAGTGVAGCLLATVLLSGFTVSLAGNCCSAGAGTSGTAAECDVRQQPGSNCEPADLPGAVRGLLALTGSENSAGVAQRISQYLTRMYQSRSLTHFPVVVSEVSTSPSTAPFRPGSYQGGVDTYNEEQIKDLTIRGMQDGGSYMARNVQGRDGFYRNAMVWWFEMTANSFSQDVQRKFYRVVDNCVGNLLANPYLTTLDNCANCVHDNFSQGALAFAQGVLVVQDSLTSSQDQANQLIPTASHNSWHGMSHMFIYSREGITVFLLAHYHV